MNSSRSSPRSRACPRSRSSRPMGPASKTLDLGLERPQPLVPARRVARLHRHEDGRGHQVLRALRRSTRRDQPPFDPAAHAGRVGLDRLEPVTGRSEPRLPPLAGPEESSAGSTSSTSRAGTDTDGGDDRDRSPGRSTSRRSSPPTARASSSSGSRPMTTSGSRSYRSPAAPVVSIGPAVHYDVSPDRPVLAGRPIGHRLVPVAQGALAPGPDGTGRRPEAGPAGHGRADLAARRSTLRLRESCATDTRPGRSGPSVRPASAGPAVATGERHSRPAILPRTRF